MFAAGLQQIDPHAFGQMVAGIVGAKDPTVFFACGFAVLARLLGFFIVAPFFGGMNIPMTARVAFSVVLTAVVTPYVEPIVAPSLQQQVQDGSAFDLILLGINQVLVGLMLGFCSAFIFYAIESAGRIIDTQRGSNITDIIAPQTGERTSPTGQFLQMTTLMILLVSGMHMEMLWGFIQTFKVFPPTIGLEWLGDPLHASAHHPALQGAIKLFAELSGQSLLLTLQIAAPAMITLMLTDVLLGIVNRGAPQVNVFALSQVAKGPIGIFALMIALIPTWNYVRDHALPRFAEGSGSMVTMARTMHCADVEATRVKHGTIRRADADSCSSRSAESGDETLAQVTNDGHGEVTR